MTRFAASALLATLLFIGTSLYGQAGYTFNYSDPGFSSDGKLIVFAVLVYNFDQSGSALRSELRSINANGTNPRTLRTVTMGAISKPRFSPDGKKIVFVHESGGPYEIWLMNADGSGAEAVVANKSYNDNPMFDGDGNVVYVRDSKQVILHDVMTHAERVLLESEIVTWAIPGSTPGRYVVKYLPSGAKAMVVGQINKGEKGPAEIKDWGGKRSTDVDRFRTAADGKRALASVRDQETLPALWLRDAGTWVEARGLRARFFDLSPDGKIFVFVASPPGKNVEGIFLYDIDGKQGRPLVPPA